LSLTDRWFLYNFRLFVVLNIAYQVIFLLWIKKWGINKDKYECIVKKGENWPQTYVSQEDFDRIMNDPSAVNVGKKFKTVFEYCLITYVALDIDMVIALWQYRKSVLDYSYRPNFKLVICIFIYFVFFGVVELIMIIALRLTREGRVCSGSYISEHPDHYTEDTYEYYMTYEGNFAIFVVAQEVVQVIAYLILFRRVNAQRPKDIDIFKTYISPSMYMPYSRATQLILDQWKFKQAPPKYPTLTYVYQLEEFYQIDKELTGGNIGNVKLATNVSEHRPNEKNKRVVIKEIDLTRFDKE